jgi:hypothetical protein
MAAQAFLGAGDIYIELLEAGAYTGKLGPFYATKLELKPAVRKEEAKSKGRYTFGQPIETVLVPEPTAISIELIQSDADGVSYALQATKTALSQISGSLMAETFLAKKGFWVELTKNNLAASAMTVTNVGATVTYVEGTDYVLNRQLGWIKILPASAIVDAVSLRFTGAYLAKTGTLLKGSAKNQIRGRIWMDGVNLADSLPVTVFIDDAVLSSGSGFDFLSGKFESAKLDGSLNTLPGKTQPYTVEIFSA